MISTESATTSQLCPLPLEATSAPRTGIEEPVMTSIADSVIEAMKDAYPELERQRKFVMDILAPEERRFDETLHRGVVWKRAFRDNLQSPQRGAIVQFEE